MSSKISDNPTENRYEIYQDNELAGFVTYKLTGDEIAFTHTETLPAFTGKGVAKQLVTEALEDARFRGLAVLPFCPYVRRFISQNTAKYLDLVPENDRERFGLISAAG
jgi:predicted GNAT family acetyltransferase